MLGLCLLSMVPLAMVRGVIAEREALLSRSAIGREFLAVTKRQPFDVVKELFENEHVQLLFLFKVSLFGTWLVDTMSGTSPMGSVIRAFDLESGYQLCQGGSFNLARGLMETFIAAGGRYQPQVHIDKILIEGGKASGIVPERAWRHERRHRDLSE